MADHPHHHQPHKPQPQPHYPQHQPHEPHPYHKDDNPLNPKALRKVISALDPTITDYELDSIIHAVSKLDLTSESENIMNEQRGTIRTIQENRARGQREREERRTLEQILRSLSPSITNGQLRSLEAEIEGELRNEHRQNRYTTRAPYGHETTPKPYQTPTHQQPESSYHQIGSYFKPEPTYSQPEPTYSKPEPTYSKPEPTYSKPEPTYPTPKPTYHQPEPTYHQPARTYHQPEQVYQYPTTTTTTTTTPKYETTTKYVAKTTKKPFVSHNAYHHTDGGSYATVQFG